MARKNYDIEDSVHHIAEIIITKVVNDIRQNKFDCGLLSGTLGCFVFWSHYLQLYHKSSSYNLFLSAITDYSLKLSKVPIQLNYINGLTGIIKGLKLINNSNLVVIDNSSLINCAKPQVIHYLNNCFKETDIDFLYGSIGITYGLCDDDEIAKLFISLAQNRICLTKIFNRNYKFGCPFGSAHGVSALLSLLYRIICNYNENSVEIKLIRNFINVTLDQLIDVRIYRSYFPTLYNGIKSKSDLAWCKGDLSLSLTLLKISLNLGFEDIVNLSLDILYNCAKRVLLTNEGLDNYTMCHGSAGIGLMFDEAYNLTNDILFKKAEQLCLNKSIKLINESINQHAYLKTDLLEGISGVGMYLLDSQSKSNLQDMLLI